MDFPRKGGTKGSRKRLISKGPGQQCEDFNQGFKRRRLQSAHHNHLEFQCNYCHKHFQNFRELLSDISSHTTVLSSIPGVTICEYCGKLFKGNKYLEVHCALAHRCNYCTLILPNALALDSHKSVHDFSLPQVGGANVRDTSNSVSCFDVTTEWNCFKVYKYNRAAYVKSIAEFLNSKWAIIRDVVAENVRQFPIKIQFRTLVHFQRGMMEAGTLEEFETYLNSFMRIILNENEVNKILTEIINQIAGYVDIFERHGSGWRLFSVQNFQLRINKFKTLGGGCYVKTPPKVYAKKCVVNIRNEDVKYCFKWAVLAALHPSQTNVNAVSTYRAYESNYVFDDSLFPMTTANIAKFETQNNIAVNVFSWTDGEGLYPVTVSKNNYRDEWQTVNLLLLKDPLLSHSHYATIKSMSKLIGKQNCHKKQICFSCLQCFSDRVELDSHRELCQKFKNQVVEIPSELNGKKPVLSFENHSKQLKAGFVVYADFECILSHFDDTATCKSKKTKEHKPFAFSYALVRDDGELIRQFVYRGEDCLKVFYDHMTMIGCLIRQIYGLDVGPTYDEDEWEKVVLAEKCHICNEDLNSDRVVDHCHRTGKIRGAAHVVCNLNYQQQRRFPVILHNMKSYDGHLLVQGLRHYNGEKVSVIPNNSEKYLAIICDDFYFMDSMQFLSASLSDLLSNLLKPAPGSNADDHRREKLRLMYQVFNNDEQVQLLTRKGVFPYDYLDHPSRLLEETLPPKECFFNQLTNKSVTESDYNHAQNVFNKFQCKSLGDYSDIYLASDVLILASIFENFRDVSMKHYKLDVCHYYSLPGYSWDACMKMTGVKLEQLTDIDQLNFIQSGIRGGISLISTRYCEARNKYLNNLSSEDKSLYISYIDRNNLYGEAMSDLLPVSDFKWLSDEEVAKFNPVNVDPNGDLGYILSVDLDYPEELHDLHNLYPLAPDRYRVKYDELSDYQKTLVDEKSFQESDKLIAHLGSRREYVVHLRNLQFYVAQGMKLRKVHKVLQFKQSRWLKSYVDYNTLMRRNSTTDFEKSFFKLLVNSFFGKTMENTRKRSSVTITNQMEKALKLASDPRCKSWDILDHELIFFILDRRKVKLDRPIYIGFTILELSKLYMYDYYYNHLQPKYNNRVKLLFSDTDSLCFAVETDDLYTDMYKDRHLYDTSDYPPSHRLHSDVNKKKLGKFKDEANGVVLREFVGCSSKNYSLIGESNLHKKACKGTPKQILLSELTHARYKQALFDSNKFYFNFSFIRSFKHRIFSVNQTKLCLHSTDTKRFILNNGIDTLAFNHYRLKSS